ncbi:MAG: hypothetical protein LKE27_04730 [Atopobiaceae bacterium]|jgi:peptide/nickel transport system permease protein|nr:hypothetical protein [Atopobiaceae bacterium]
MTEKIFAIHGMGEYFINCINNNNINGAVAVAAFSGACTLVGALARGPLRRGARTPESR